MPEPARQIFEAEHELRRLLGSASATYADFEKVAVRTGAMPESEAGFIIPMGRWSYHPNGFFIRYEPRAVIHHRAWRGPEEYIPLRWRYGVGQGAYYAKHMRVRDRYMLGRLARLLRRHLWLAAKRLGREPRAAGVTRCADRGTARGLRRADGFRH